MDTTEQQDGQEPAGTPESLTTSTESECLDSWTLVTERARPQQSDRTPNVSKAKEAEETDKNSVEEDEEDHVEIIGKDDSNKRDIDSTDDLSDGISIISDSESAGRISPHPLFTQPRTVITKEVKVEQEAETPLLPVLQKKAEVRSCVELLERSQERGQQTPPIERDDSRPLLRKGVRGLFYFGIVIAVAAFIGKMKYPEWSLSSQLSPLAQRVEDLEMQNNLLRAELDILSKQLNYLNQQKDNRDRFSKGESTSYGKMSEGRPAEGKRRDSPKIWLGAGDLEDIQPVEAKVTVEEAVKKCPWGAKCSVEPPREQEKEYNERKPRKEDGRRYEEPRQKYPERTYPSGDGGKYQKQDNGKKQYEHDGRKWEKRDYKEHEKLRKFEPGRKDRGDHSEEDDSRERRYDHEKRRRNDKHDDDWHQKMMQNREDQRKKQWEKNSNNWYIERGSGREEARIVERKDDHRRR